MDLEETHMSHITINNIHIHITNTNNNTQ